MVDASRRWLHRRVIRDQFRVIPRGLGHLTDEIWVAAWNETTEIDHLVIIDRQYRLNGVHRLIERRGVPPRRVSKWDH